MEVMRVFNVRVKRKPFPGPINSKEILIIAANVNTFRRAQNGDEMRNKHQSIIMISAAIMTLEGEIVKA